MAEGEREAPCRIQWIKGAEIGKDVYLAMDAIFGDLMAIKELHFHPSVAEGETETDTWQRRLATEILSQSERLLELKHENLVHYLRFHMSQDCLQIFQEYIPGGSLHTLITSYGNFEENLIKKFARQILRGLSFLHAGGTVHGNLKTQNILVNNAGTCKIGDVGISQCLDNSVRNDEDATRAFFQKAIFWIPPEVLADGKLGIRNDAKIDIWSFGCVILEMGLGERPWAQEDTVSALYKLGVSRLAPPIPDPESLSEAAVDFIRLCFSIEPEGRPTADELLQHRFMVE